MFQDKTCQRSFLAFNVECKTRAQIETPVILKQDVLLCLGNVCYVLTSIPRFLPTLPVTNVYWSLNQIVKY